MLKIQSTNNDNITKENLHEQSLATLILEANNPITLFKNPEAAEKARAIFFDSTVNTKIVEIAKKFEALSSEYSAENIAEVFKDVIDVDQQLYIDIISAAYYIAIKYSDMEYVKFMYNMCDIINEELGIVITDAPEETSETASESEETSTEKEVEFYNDDEGIK